MVTAVATSNIVPLFGGIGRFSPDPDAELISGVLLLLEEAVCAHIVIDGVDLPEGRRVFLRVGDQCAGLTPDQARSVARCLFDEQAFAGCGEVAARLIEASVSLPPSFDGPARDIVQIMPAPRRASHVTGMASTLCLMVLVLFALMPTLIRAVS